MCYHKLFLFNVCGHAYPSPLPIRYSRCPVLSPPSFGDTTHPLPAPTISPWRLDSVPDFPTTPLEPTFEAWERHQSRVEIAEAQRALLAEKTKGNSRKGNLCGQILSHPMQTFRVEGICGKCNKRREDRLRRFEEGVLNSFALDTQDRIQRGERDWMRWFDGKDYRGEKREKDKQRPSLARIKLLDGGSRTESERAVLKEDPWGSSMSIGTVKFADVAVATKPKVVEKGKDLNRRSRVVDSVLEEDVNIQGVEKGKRRKSRDLLANSGTAPGGANWI